MNLSPYKDKPQKVWLSITKKLVEDYPLTTDEILEISLLVWDKIWTTKVGNTIKLSEVELTATVIGYFFQKLFAHELAHRYPNKWRGEQNKEDKDIVYIDNEKFSTEMKSSGQIGYKIFGNRSYNQDLQNNKKSNKDKSGYYITINFVGQILTLVRLGWIDEDDWVGQTTESGQASTLKKEAYQYKLIEINGEYRLISPIELLYGVGESFKKKFNQEGLYTFNDIINYNGTTPKVLLVKEKNKELFNKIIRSYNEQSITDVKVATRVK